MCEWMESSDLFLTLIGVRQGYVDVTPSLLFNIYIDGMGRMGKDCMVDKVYKSED